jgi:hypothetical protein
MKHSRTVVVTLVAAALLLLALSSSLAQISVPTANHYRVYLSSSTLVTQPLTLRNEFDVLTIDQIVLDRWSNPAEKRLPDGTDYPIVDPVLHYNWGHFFFPHTPRNVVGTDQFGTRTWTLGNAVYVLSPAIKNPQPPLPQPPVANHYLCYDAIGLNLGKQVTLIDQWGNCQVVVLKPKYFCTPVIKTTAFASYPIIDPKLHYTCYDLQPPCLNFQAITVVDQFGYWNKDVYDNDCLCLPALRDATIGTAPTTWGKVKALYAN